VRLFFLEVKLPLIFDSATELRKGLEENQGVSKFKQVHEFRKAAKSTYGFAKVVFHMYLSGFYISLLQ
jgi:hypothetical protein